MAIDTKYKKILSIKDFSESKKKKLEREISNNQNNRSVAIKYGFKNIDELSSALNGYYGIGLADYKEYHSKKKYFKPIKKFINENKNKDQLLFTIESQNYDYFSFVIKTQEKLENTLRLLNEPEIKPMTSKLFHICNGSYQGFFYELIDRKVFLKSFDLIMLRYKERYRLIIERFDIRQLCPGGVRSLALKDPLEFYKIFIKDILSSNKA